MIFSVAIMSLGISIMTCSIMYKNLTIYIVGIIIYVVGLICGFGAEKKLKSIIKKLEDKIK